MKFQPFIEGEEVLLVTDHSTLQWARTYKNANRRLVAWGAIFSMYTAKLEIIHHAGRVHSNVDPLSRLPRAPLGHISPIELDEPSIHTVRFRSILYTEDRGEVEDRRDTTGMNIVWGIQ